MKKSKILLPLAFLGMVFGVAACNNANANEGAKSGGEQQQQSAGPVETDPAKQEKINITSPDGKKAILFGETLQLSADQEGVAWESSKPEVATVSATGLVTAVSKGSTTIKATKAGFKDGSFNLSVDYPDITVTAAGEKDILIGGQVTLTASEQGVTWSSSDPEVAKVENGVVTGLKLGTATIKASKEHFNDGSVVINVVRPAVTAELDLVVAADHYSADGWWELPSSGGFGFAMQTVAGWNPTAQQSSWGQQVENPEIFIGGFGTGDKETIKFTSSKAVKAELVLNIGNSDEVALGSVMSAKLNTAAIDLSQVTLAANPGDWGNSLVFNDLSLGELDLVAGENTLEFEFLADTNIFLDELDIYAGDAQVTLVEPAPKTQISFTSTEVEVIEEATLQLAVDQEGVTWVSLDETVATVSDAGLVTGVKMGKVNIRAKKAGLYSAQVEITVNPKPVAGQILLEAEDAEELADVEPGGFNMNGPSIMQDGGMMGGSEVHSGGAYVMAMGASELVLTFKFNSDAAKTMVLSVVGASGIMKSDYSGYEEQVLADCFAVKLNDIDVTVGEGSFPEGGSMMSNPMSEVVIGDVNVQSGENTLVVTITGSIPTLDVFKLSVKA